MAEWLSSIDNLLFSQINFLMPWYVICYKHLWWIRCCLYKGLFITFGSWQKLALLFVQLRVMNRELWWASPNQTSLLYDSTILYSFWTLITLEFLSLLAIVTLHAVDMVGLELVLMALLLLEKNWLIRDWSWLFLSEFFFYKLF